jgi:hypothetical protein
MFYHGTKNQQGIKSLYCGKIYQLFRPKMCQYCREETHSCSGLRCVKIISSLQRLDSFAPRQLIHLLDFNINRWFIVDTCTSYSILSHKSSSLPAMGHKLFGPAHYVLQIPTATIRMKKNPSYAYVKWSNEAYLRV